MTVWNTLTKRNRTAKLTLAQVERVILEAKAPEDDKRLAAEFGVTQNAIGEIRRGKKWYNVRARMRAEGRL